MGLAGTIVPITMYGLLFSCTIKSFGETISVASQGENKLKTQFKYLSLAISATAIALLASLCFHNPKVDDSVASMVAHLPYSPEILQIFIAISLQAK